MAYLEVLGKGQGALERPGEREGGYRRPGERKTERAGAKRQTFHGYGEQSARQARDG